MNAFKVISKKTGETYYLHFKKVVLRGNNPQNLFYFARVATEYVIDSVPEGYEVSENRHTGLPILKKIRL